MVDLSLLFNQFLMSFIMTLIVIPIIIYFLRVRKKEGKDYLINVLIRSKPDYIYKLRTKKLDFVFKWKNKRYHVKNKDLYQKQRNILRKLYDKIRKKYDKEYLICYYENDPNPIKLMISEKSPVTINKLRESKIILKAIREQFARAWASNRTIFLILIFFIMIMLAVTKYLGYW